jgi:hypothetical protein
VLNVATDRIDSAIGTGKCGPYSAIVIGAGGNLFDAIVLGAPSMPRDYAHPGANLVQMAHDASANKAGPSKHCYAAHSPIRRSIRHDTLD